MHFTMSLEILWLIQEHVMMHTGTPDNTFYYNNYRCVYGLRKIISREF